MKRNTPNHKPDPSTGESAKVDENHLGQDPAKGDAPGQPSGHVQEGKATQPHSPQDAADGDLPGDLTDRAPGRGVLEVHQDELDRDRDPTRGRQDVVRRRQLRAKALTKFLRQVEPPATLDMSFVLQDVQDPVNVGSAFRIADACGVRRMLLTGITTCPPHPLIKKVGRGRDRRIQWDYVEDAATGLMALREEGYHCVAVEIASDAERYDQVSYPDRVALVVGHEDHGVTNRTLAACDRVVFLPMLGKGASLNVHVSLGIMAYHVLGQALPAP